MSNENEGQRDRVMETVYRAGLAVGAEVGQERTPLGDHYAPWTVDLDEDGRVRPLTLEGLRRAEPPLIQRHVTLLDQASFEEYVQTFARLGVSRCYANPEALAVTAVLDDHRTFPADSDGEPLGDEWTPDWCEHRATLALVPDPDWQRWADHDGERMTQEAFAEFIEEVSHTIRRKPDDGDDVPDEAAMLRVARQLHVTESQSVRGNVRYDGPTVSLDYHAEATASVEDASVQVPTQFRIQVSPFEGAPAYWLDVRFRFRLADGRARIWYAIIGKDRFLRQAFSDLAADLKKNLGLPVLLGRL